MIRTHDPRQAATTLSDHSLDGRLVRLCCIRPAGRISGILCFMWSTPEAAWCLAVPVSSTACVLAGSLLAILQLAALRVTSGTEPAPRLLFPAHG